MEKREKEYFLCGQAVIDIFKPEEVSKPIEWGPEFDDKDKVYIAVIDFDKVEKYHEENEETVSAEFWARELVEGTMRTDNISLKSLKKNNFFTVMRRKLNLSTERNLAMCVYNVAQAEKITPIELFNLLHQEYEKHN